MTANDKSELNIFSEHSLKRVNFLNYNYKATSVEKIEKITNFKSLTSL